MEMTHAERIQQPVIAQRFAETEEEFQARLARIDRCIERERRVGQRQAWERAGRIREARLGGIPQ